ncbi:hypothetical protein TIFTF001_023315 [Ficus carica]|uniref:NAC domain-containing protein n=1 Tax=Ficus carica TaxID=3494 RepID=A0AA88AFY6_FICCA|nr:hypothetical protein TIFTF001_023315 [Ficus carica]
MENVLGQVKEDERLDLPPGFRFHPTDEELISHYLYKKVVDINFACRAIGEVDLNKCEPWDLPWKAKMGEKEWYFFCVRDRKYPTGLRTNRATEAGYWKATGKDKEIYRGKSLVGMKKTLVFYKGRAPKGEKSNWGVPKEFWWEENPDNRVNPTRRFQDGDGFPGQVLVQDQSIFRALLENNGSALRQSFRAEIEMRNGTHETTTTTNEITSVMENLEMGRSQAGPLDLEGFWSC